MVENQQFIKFCKLLRADTPVLSADTLKRDILKLDTEYRQRLKTELGGLKQMTLLCDGWTSNCASFQLYCIVAGYVDNALRMRQKIVGVFDAPSSSAADLHSLIVNELLKSGLSLSQFKFIVCDGGSNLIKFAETTSLGRVHCGAHQLHLAVNEFSKVADVQRLSEKCRKIAKTLSKSTKTKDEARKQAADLNITHCLPQCYSPTRWNGLRDLLSATRAHIPTFSALSAFSDVLLGQKEQNLMNFLINFTGPISDASYRFESEQCPASELLPQFILVSRNIEEISQKFTEDTDFSAICAVIGTVTRKAETALNARVDTMKNSKLLQLATFTDPRFCLTAILDIDFWTRAETALLLIFPGLVVTNS